MTTTLTETETTTSDTYVTLSGIDWAGFEAIARRTRGGRITYDKGELEIMSPGRRHENHRHALAELVLILCRSLGMDLIAQGSTTLHAGDEQGRGIEPDEAFVFDPAKLALVEALHEAGEEDMSRYPSPDLVIEIDMRRPARDRLAVYETIRAVEVWEFDGKAVRILVRNPGGGYTVSERSVHFPVTADQLGRLMAAGLPVRFEARQRVLQAFVAKLLKK
jgi:Uma2 family endonuclease